MRSLFFAILIMFVFGLTGSSISVPVESTPVPLPTEVNMEESCTTHISSDVEAPTICVLQGGGKSRERRKFGDCVAAMTCENINSQTDDETGNRVVRCV